MSRKIAILGTAEPHWRQAPFGDETWEIWTCGGVFATCPRVDRHIEIHRLDQVATGWSGDEQQDAVSRNVYIQWMREQGPKVYAQPAEMLPDATPYPISDVLARFPDAYFTNTISYMIGLALVEGCTDIGLWGVDMAMSSGVRESDEYGNQRPSCEFYLGVAVGMGVRVTLPPQTTLLKTRKLYGFAPDDGVGPAMMAKVEELQRNEQEARQVKLKARHEMFEAEKAEVAMKEAAKVAHYFYRNFAE